MKFQSPKGTRDFYPADMAVRHHIEAAWRQASIRHGFEEIDGPTFEHLDLYRAKSGDAIVNELFSFRRAGGTDDYALRPEFTPTLARMVAAKGPSLAVPVKWFAVPNFFRAERPQRGRLREFYQWNVDMLGSESVDADVEVISVAVLALESLGLSPVDVRVRISHRAALAQALIALGIPGESHGAAFELLDRKDRLEAAEFETRAKAIGFGIEALQRLAEVASMRLPLAGGAAAAAQALGIPLESLANLESLATRLTDASLAQWCEFDLGIVRGLAYYTGTVFEIHESSGAERAIAGGGRYDKLVETFGGPSMPAVGFGMGDVVLGLVLRDKALLPADGAALLPRPDVFLLSVAGEETDAAVRQQSAQLRRVGLHVRHSYKATRNVGKLLAEAGKCRARFAAIFGAELTEGRVALKDLDGGGQESILLSELAARVRAI
ncbi:MAG: histidine--tRNA ligase [Phycisphaerales bacterium]|nr:histidine--tRNA ligase [Phycisphaerales bacterium]